MFKRSLFLWAERYFYSPNFTQICISYMLLPLSLLYFLAIYLKFAFKIYKKGSQKYEIPIISVGNLVLGGSGKTPFTKMLFEHFSPKFRTFIVLRGYGRKSSGAILVAKDGEILTNVKKSGDEAMEYALSLCGANVIVSANRALGIKMAMQNGANLILLDDGFSKFQIAKFDILLHSRPFSHSNFTLPSGAYRYPKSFAKFADLIIEDGDLTRKSEIVYENLVANSTPNLDKRLKNKAQDTDEISCKNLLLITAIAKPKRLCEYFSLCVGVEIFEDHHDFTFDEIENLLQKYDADCILTTMKDYAKLKELGFKCAVIKLELKLNPKKLNLIENFVQKNAKFAQIRGEI